MTAEAAIRRIDAAMVAQQARQVGSMMVTADDPAYDVNPEKALLEVKGRTAEQVLANISSKYARYQTAPFDVDGEQLRFYPGGVSIWSGFPGSGKTTILRQMACHLASRNEKVFFASLEEDPENLLVGLAAVASGYPLGELPPEWAVQAFMDAWHDRIAIWGVIGIASHRRLLAVIRKLAESGLTHAIIDSLMCLDVANDDIEAQRKFANLCAATARATGVHIHLVAHPRKPMQRDQEPDLGDVAGAKEIGGIADNVLFVRRGGDGMQTGDVVPMKISVKKQRHWKGGWPTYDGFLHHRYRQCLMQQLVDYPIRYLPTEAYR